MVKFLPVLLLLLVANQTEAQAKKKIYHPCFLMDSVEQHLDFIRLNSAKVFTDTFECRQALLNKIADEYIHTHQLKYLETLAAIRQNPNAKAADLFTDVMKKLAENNFSDLLNRLYMAHGKFLLLEKELVAAMNMLVDGRRLEQKYTEALNAEIEKAKQTKDNYKVQYLQKLKLKIQNEKY
jgi:hypothetical protein